MRITRLLLIPLALLIAASLPLSARAASDSPAPVSGQSLRVYYAGPEGSLSTALGLADAFTRTEDPDQADVLVLNGTIPDPEAAANRVQVGAGLVLIMGPQVTAAQLATIFGAPITTIETRQDPLSLIDAPDGSDPLRNDIVWNSAPQIRERYLVHFPEGEPQPAPLITGFEDGEAVLSKLSLGAGRVYLLSFSLNGANPQFQEWAYFNYFAYAAVIQAGGQTPLKFAAYPASPVPHPREQIILILLLSGTVLVAVLVFFAVRRYSLAHPEALDELVVDRREFMAREESTPWEEVGFHRPLGGFMVALMLGLVMFIPLIVYQNLILPAYILPSAQALGIWGRVTQFFNLLWLLFDMGTSAAFIKFFAQYRVHQPRHAILYGQVFVWWQAISGAVQVALITAVAGTLLPRTAYALYTWSIILHTLIQIPGFLQVFRHAFLGWQRFDYGQALEIGLYAFFPIIAQPVIVTLMVAWGRAHPVFGPSMGGLFGLGLAAYASEALAFLVGLWFYRRLGYNARLLFLAHFDWGTVKNAFRFGVFEMLGSVAWAVGQSMEIVVTQTRLVNYTEVWGNWVLAQNFVFGFNVLQSLYNNLMPSISESISHARMALSQYYSVMAYKWGGLISAFIGAVLLAVADRFILGASGPDFARAATYAIPLIIWGAIQYPSWVGDTVQLGANRPYLKTTLVAGEQITRILVVFLLVARFQINALIIGYFVGLFAKDIAAYFINNRLCYPQRFFTWQSLTAPLLAGAAHYAILRWVTGMIWQNDQITSVLIFLIGILFSYPLFVFFYGLFGGWDDATLAEVRQSIGLSGIVRPLVWVFWAASALGARLSPLHGRFPITIRDQALDEARTLTAERVSV